MLNFSDGLIEMACLTVGNYEDDITLWIDHFAETVNGLLPDNVYYDKHSDVVFFYKNDRPVFDKHGDPCDDIDISLTYDELEKIFWDASCETDDWWAENFIPEF